MKQISLLSVVTFVCFFTLGGLLDPIEALAQRLKCGQPYTTKVDDSLTSIAQDAYGAASRFRIIYSANASVIGPNPSLLPAGVVLQIPCLDDLVPSNPNAPVVQQEPTTEALPEPESRHIRVVVGTGRAPFTDESQEQGGMMTELTKAALSLAEGNPTYQIDFINDWGAHLQPLITDHAYDFSIAWFRPNCKVVDRLSDDSKFRCNNLDWSAPLFEQIIGYYTRGDQPKPASHKDLFGLTICRPSGYATFMMEEKGLVEPNIVFKRPGLTTDCFEGLLNGTYDVVVLNSETSEGAITKIGAKGKVAFHEHLSYVATMHAVIAKTNPRGKEYLATLDSGIKKIKESGEWFQIVARHMSQYRAKTK